jgi:hypothetical protein
MRKQPIHLPLVILRRIAERVIAEKVITFGVYGVGKPIAIKVRPETNLIEFAPRPNRIKMKVYWGRLERMFDECKSICVGLEGGKKMFEAKGNYEGYETTIRIYCVPR